MRRTAVGVLISLAALAASAQNSNRPEVLSAAGGRFVFGQVNEFGRDKFMLDTQTGRLWRLVCVRLSPSGGCEGGSVLEPVEFAQPDGKYADVPPRLAQETMRPSPPAAATQK